MSKYLRKCDDDEQDEWEEIHERWCARQYEKAEKAKAEKAKAEGGVETVSISTRTEPDPGANAADATPKSIPERSGNIRDYTTSSSAGDPLPPSDFISFTVKHAAHTFYVAIFPGATIEDLVKKIKYDQQLKEVDLENLRLLSRGKRVDGDRSLPVTALPLQMRLVIGGTHGGAGPLAAAALTLGLEFQRIRDASLVKKAYHQLCLTHHPDKHPGNKAAEEKSKEIQSAYEEIMKVPRVNS